MAFFTAGHAASVIRDKFLVMSTELEDAKSPSELAALWKTLPKTNIVEHRYNCVWNIFGVVGSQGLRLVICAK